MSTVQWWSRSDGGRSMQSRMGQLLEYMGYWVTLRVVLVVLVAYVSEGVAGADSGAVLQQEGAALCALLHSTRGDSWRWRPEILAGAVWNCSVDAAGGLMHNPCSHGGSSWQGVTCSSTPAECSSQVCQVTQLELPLFNMTGPIPPEIGNLTSLEILSMRMNAVTGSIPVKVGLLTALRQLLLDFNQLSGPIPVEVGQLTALERLFLQVNHLTQPIPVEIGKLTGLRELYLHTNEFRGPLPVEVGHLSRLQQIFIHSCQLTGPIPSEVGHLIDLQHLILFNNRLNGTIPGEVGNLSALEQLVLNSNKLSGTIPIQVGRLTSLDVLYLYDNELTGPIPTEVGNLLSLRQLHIHTNRLCGSLPVEIGQLIVLRELNLYTNQLTGSIPVEIGQLTALSHMILFSNHLTGPIPSEVGNLNALEIVFLHGNQLTGYIPVELGQITAVQQLVLHTNHLSGPIPPEIGNLTLLQYLYLHNNYLSGPILPTLVSGLVGVEEFFVYDNLLVGSLPVEMSRMTNIIVLLMYNNKLTGKLEGVFNYTEQLFLTTLDFSNNRLTGWLASEMFMLPRLQVLSLSVNCFDEEIPHSLCSAEQVEVLSLNGLRAADGCAGRFVVPLSGVALFNTIGGTVPPCVWDMRNLTVLHLVGNGLSGSLATMLPASNRLVDLSISHNQLTGTIPVEFFKVSKLDLSFNQLDGEYTYHSQNILENAINLEINRLSGPLPMSGLEHLSNGSLRILRGNMFSCNTIPDSDEYSRDYVCGSLHLDYSILAFTSIAGGISIVILAVIMILRGRETSFKDYNFVCRTITLLRMYAVFVQILDASRWRTPYSETLLKIQKLSGTFLEVRRCAVQLLTVILVASVSIYVVKILDISGEYSTHKHTYSWFWSLAYMRGMVPACLLILVWTGAIVACFWRVVILGYYRPIANEVSKVFVNRLPADSQRSAELYIPIWFGFVINAFITIAVNVLYIFSTQLALKPSVHFAFQLSLSAFRLLYAMIALPMISRSIVSTVANVRFRFFLLTINNLLIPCLVTALTSEPCFQGLLIPADSIRTPYSYDSCLTYFVSSDTGEVTCIEYGTIWIESSSLVPPFTYNAQCGSVLLTAYIPVLMLGFALQLLFSLIIVVLMVQFPYTALPSPIRNSIHGLMWPDIWRQKETLEHNKATVDLVPSVVLQIRTIFCNDVMNNLLLLLTFGLCSPILAVAIVCCVLQKMTLWVVVIGRFTRCVLQCEAMEVSSQSSIAVKENDNATYFALSALAQVHTPLLPILAQSFWRLAWCSALFVALVSWDMAADGKGGVTSLWAPALPFAVLIGLRCVAYYVNQYGYIHARQEVSEEAYGASQNADVESDGSGIRMSQNPLHRDNNTTF